MQYAKSLHTLADSFLVATGVLGSHPCEGIHASIANTVEQCITSSHDL